MDKSRGKGHWPNHELIHSLVVQVEEVRNLDLAHN